jgi:hypothetical protein
MRFDPEAISRNVHEALWWPLSFERVHVLPYPEFKWAANVVASLAALALLGAIVSMLILH